MPKKNKRAQPWISNRKKSLLPRDIYKGSQHRTDWDWSNWTRISVIRIKNRRQKSRLSMKYQTTYNPSITSSPFQRNGLFTLQTASYLSWASIFREYFGGGWGKENKGTFGNLYFKKPETIQDMHFIIINKFIWHWERRFQIS